MSRGKHQLFRFDNDYTLHTHFRMDGTWRIYPRGRKWAGGPDWQIRAVLATTDHDAVGYRLPVTELVATADEESVVGHLGPDLLGPDWDLDEALRRIESQPERSIGEALLDQRNLAGIGTFYRAELCFLQGTHPAHAGAAGAEPATVGAAWSATPLREPVAAGTVDDRRPAGRQARVRVRAARRALPSLRYADPHGGVRPAGSGTPQLLVSEVSAGGLSAGAPLFRQAPERSGHHAADLPAGPFLLGSIDALVRDGLVDLVGQRSQPQRLVDVGRRIALPPDLRVRVQDGVAVTGLS